MACPTLRDRRVLIVEDEYLIAISLRDHLESVGSTVIGPSAFSRKSYSPD
jgi:hypothetical protein